MGKKFERCVKKVRHKSKKVNPYAVCKSSINMSRELKIGTMIERKEHGFSYAISKKIARDHIRENRNYYSINKKHFTSTNDKHRHIWIFTKKRTSINSRHSHPINLKKMIAEKGRTNHTHRLLK